MFGFDGASGENEPPAIFSRSRLMNDRLCRYCQQAFQPDPYHPQQRVCNQPACQSQRRSDYHRQRIATDPVYQQVCLDSPRKWRETHRDYWRKYRQDHPQQVERNRQQQQLRDQKRLVRNLANNNLAVDLTHFAVKAWLLGTSADDLANNNLAAAKLLILQPARTIPAAGKASCKQHPSGVAPAASL